MGVRPVTAGQDSGVLSGTGMANRSTVPASVAEHVRRIRSLATGCESRPLAPPVQRGERGTTALEMAFILPVLLLLTIGMVDAGRLLQAYVTVNHAAREAARFAVTGHQFTTASGYLSRADSVAQRARDSLIGLDLAPTGAADPYAWGAYAIRVNPTDVGGPGELVEVEVYYTVRLFTPGLASTLQYVRVAGYERMLNERFGVVPSLDRANIPATPVPPPTYTPLAPPSSTPSPTPSPTPTATPTATPSPTASSTGSPTRSPAATPLATVTP